MRRFTWRPRHNPGAEPIIIDYDENYVGECIVTIPPDVVTVESTVDGVVVTLPVRALAEFGVRAAHVRVEATLRRLLGRLDASDVTS